MEPLRRQIHPEVRILDEERGLARYIASDESIDSYREVVRAKGWRFDLFKKNSPFVDSHNYETIENLVGKVTAFHVEGSKLIVEVQWAIDAPDNRLARLGWQMTKAGYLKAVSVGFRPVKYVTPNDGNAYSQQLKELGFDFSTQPKVIYTEQQLLELSSVIIGANGNALLEAHKAGAIKDADVELLRQRGAKSVFQIPFPDVPSTPEPSMSSKLLSKGTVLAAFSDKITPKQAFEALVKARREGSDVDMERTLRRALTATEAVRQRRVFSAVEHVLDADPLRRALLNAFPRRLMDVPLPKEMEELARAFGEAQSIGAGAIPAVFGEDLFDLLPDYGAFASLSVRPVGNRRGKFPVTTAYPNALFILENDPVSDDALLAGTSVTAETVLIGTLVNCSRQLVEDVETDLSEYFLDNMMQAMGQRLDTACFIGTGASDANNGGVTGIFADAGISTVNAAAGHTKLENCDKDDFAKVMEAVDAATLQRPCRWWISSALLPALLRCKDTAGNPLLEFHPEAGGFYLLGFPVTLVAVAPSTNAANQKVAAFGDPRSYVVPMRNEFALDSSGHSRWSNFQRTFRANTKATGKLRKAQGFAVLRTAAS